MPTHSPVGRRPRTWPARNATARAGGIVPPTATSARFGGKTPTSRDSTAQRPPRRSWRRGNTSSGSEIAGRANFAETGSASRKVTSTASSTWAIHGLRSSSHGRPRRQTTSRVGGGSRRPLTDSAPRPRHRLGACSAWLALVRDVERGTIALASASERPDADPPEAGGELAELVAALVESDLPEADRALHAVARLDHPLYPIVATAILDTTEMFNPYSAWRRHPFCLAVLRHGLDDTRLTGPHFYLRGDEIESTPVRQIQTGRLGLLIEEFTRRGDGRSRLPAHRPDRKDWLEHAEQRVCDVAAQRLTEMIAGVE